MKRILHDIKVLTDDKYDKYDKLFGIEICLPNDDIFTPHANILVQDGLYKGLTMHVVLHIPKNYPYTGPAGNMGKNFPFNHKYHEHIHNDLINGHAICNDMLTNFASWFDSQNFGKKIVGTGWSSAYTLQTILLQLSTFFTQSDLDKIHEPKANDIVELAKIIDNYVCPECGLSTKAKQETMVTPIANIPKQNLQCMITKQDYIANPKMVLGYVIDVRFTKRKKQFEILLDLICEDVFLENLNLIGIHSTNQIYTCYNIPQISFYSTTCEKYNYWLPIYIDKNHFKNSESIRKNILLAINGDINASYVDAILQVIPCLINKTFVRIIHGDMHESDRAIEIYFNLIRLWKEYLNEYKELEELIIKEIMNFITDVKMRHKEYIPDIGEFMIKLLLLPDGEKYYKQIKSPLLEEYFARQVFWIEKNSKINLVRDTNINLQNVFNGAKVSNQLLVFNLHMLKIWSLNDTQQNLDDNFGMVSNEMIKLCQNKWQDIKKNINNYKTFFESIGYGYIDSDELIHMFIKKMVKMSLIQKYI